MRINGTQLKSMKMSYPTPNKVQEKRWDEIKNMLLKEKKILDYDEILSLFMINNYELNYF